MRLTCQKRAVPKHAGDTGNGASVAPPAYGMDFVDRGLPDDLRAGIESLSGLDLSDVRVHANSEKPAQLNAAAYAHGDNIYLAPGQERHLPHEAWHVVQQKQGRVMPTLRIDDVDVSDDQALEREADAMGAKAASGAAGTSEVPRSGGPASPSVVQAVLEPTEKKNVYTDTRDAQKNFWFLKNEETGFYEGNNGRTYRYNEDNHQFMEHYSGQYFDPESGEHMTLHDGWYQWVSGGVMYFYWYDGDKYQLYQPPQVEVAPEVEGEQEGEGLQLEEESNVPGLLDSLRAFIKAALSGGKKELLDAIAYLTTNENHSPDYFGVSALRHRYNVWVEHEDDENPDESVVRGHFGAARMTYQVFVHLLANYQKLQYGKLSTKWLELKRDCEQKNFNKLSKKEQKRKNRLKKRMKEQRLKEEAQKSLEEQAKQEEEEGHKAKRLKPTPQNRFGGLVPRSVRRKG
jgi:hypothetical protein